MFLTTEPSLQAHFRRRVRNGQEGKAWWENREADCSLSHLHTRSRQREEEVGQSYKPSKPAPQQLTSSVHTVILVVNLIGLEPTRREAACRVHPVPVELPCHDSGWELLTVDWATAER
ncbi:hypothetical protein LEMLEM_LOCUS648, partial [Lemmus lemmus]